MEQFLLQLRADILDAQLRGIWLNLILLALFIIGYLFFIRLKARAEFKAIKDNFAELLEQNKRLTQETEQIKRELEKGTIAYQVKLSKYHDRAISALDEVYGELQKIVSAAREFSFSAQPDSKKFYEVIHNVKQCVSQHNLWIDERLYQQIMVFIERVKDNVYSSKINEFQLMYIDAGEESRAAFLEKKGEEIFHFLTEELEVVMSELRLEIQRYLKPE